MYRPPNWKYGNWQEDEAHLQSPTPIVEERLYNAYEAGADAILKALMEKGAPHVNIPDNQVGCVVYIPVQE